tara:strand:- start:55 stop:222 length:168 start_codon:yes stop_codon:yes gene_type:complete
MDKELAQWVEEVMDEQQYRDGIFQNNLRKMLHAIRDFRQQLGTRTALEIQTEVES